MKKIVLLTLTALTLLSCTNQQPTPMENVLNNLMTRVSVRDFTGEKKINSIPTTSTLIGGKFLLLRGTAGQPA